MHGAEVVVFDSIIWTLLIANILPLIVGFVTNEVTKPGAKEALLFVLAGATSWAEEVFAQGGSFVWEDFLAKLQPSPSPQSGCTSAGSAGPWLLPYSGQDSLSARRFLLTEPLP